MSEYHNYIGKYISKQRTDMGMPLREMAKILGITPAKLNDYELGNAVPPLEMLQLIEEKIGIKVDSCIEFLLNWENKKQRKLSPVKPKKVSPVTICYARDYKNNNDKTM